MAMEVFEPAGDPVSILCCLAGGPVTRRYWDLDVPGANGSYSFARTMAGKGHYVVLADHLGIGESSMPPPMELTVDVMAAASHDAFSAKLAHLPSLPAIGVGHSMGAMLTAIQQAHHHTYVAVALTGFTNAGLPDYVPAELQPFIDDPLRLRAELPAVLASRAQFPPPPAPEAPPRRPVRFHGSKLPKEVSDAVRAIAAVPPPLAAMTSMVPGSIRPEMEVIDVPVLIANGDLDITGAIEDIPAGFPKAPSVTTVVLPETGHSHHAFEGRHVLYDTLDQWVRSLGG
jgi:pimeloyl-ACP methyl ester carboxylesterase